MPLTIDIEAKSLCDIKLAGAWAYSLHESTQAMCIVGEDLETGEIRELDLRYEVSPEDVEWFNSYGVLIAHNIAFERAMFENVLHLYGFTQPDRWVDTMDIAAYMGAPLSLEGSAEFLLGDKLASQKDKEGKKFMSKICIPSNRKKGLFREYTKEDFKGLISYCAQDVKVSSDICKQYAQYIPDEEWLVMADTQRMNFRGIPIDLELVAKLMEHYEEAKKEVIVPEGFVNTDTRRTAFLLKTIQDLGGWVTDMTAETVATALECLHQMDRDSKVDSQILLLEGKQIMTLSSITKLKKLIAWCAGQPFFRNGFQYHGAKTGRDAGRGPQPQNLPKGYDNDLDVINGRKIVGAKV